MRQAILTRHVISTAWHLERAAVRAERAAHDAVELVEQDDTRQ